MEIKCITGIAHKLDLVDYMLEHLREDGFMCYSAKDWLGARDYSCIERNLEDMEESLGTSEICKVKRYNGEGEVLEGYDYSILRFSVLLPEILKYMPKVLHHRGGWFAKALIKEFFEKELNMVPGFLYHEWKTYNKESNTFYAFQMIPVTYIGNGYIVIAESFEKAKEIFQKQWPDRDWNMVEVNEYKGYTIFWD